MKLVVGTFVTLDGVMQAPCAPDEDRSGGFAHGGWLVPWFDERMGELIAGWSEAADALLLGRRTYEILAAHWPQVGDEDPLAAKLNRMRKYVASRTLEALDWNHSVLLRGDLATEVARLRQQPGGELQVSGSGELIQTLLRHDLVDEFRLWVAPLVLGRGKRLFGDGALPAALTLTDTIMTSTGVAIHLYRRAGKPDCARFAPERSSSAEPGRGAHLETAARA
jgi:dihydrofolate reductase